MSETTVTNTNTKTKKQMSTKARFTTRYIAVTAVLSAVAFVLMFFDLSVPFMPSFIKFDISDLPEVIGSFAMGPGCGVLICLIKNLLHLTRTTTMGVGELSNFILGVAFVLPAGFIYKFKKTKKGALLASIVGMVAMGAVSIASNYFLVYPFYLSFFHMQMDDMLGAYNFVLSDFFHSKLQVKNLLTCLVAFNAPFTMLKGLASVLITWAIYKPLSPILKGRDNR